MDECQSSYSKALEIGSSDLAWMNQIRMKAIDSVDIYCSWLIDTQQSVDKKVTLLLKLKEKSIDMAKCQILYQLAMIYYKSSITNLETDAKQSYKSINECSYYYEECVKMHNKIDCDFAYDFDLEDFNTNRIIQVILS
jgi:hypothetical protein